MATHSSVLAWRIPMDRGAWGTMAHRVAQSWTQLSHLARMQAHTNIQPFYVSLEPKTKLCPCLSPLCPSPLTLKHIINIKQILISHRIWLGFTMDSYFYANPLINISKVGKFSFHINLALVTIELNWGEQISFVG